MTVPLPSRAPQPPRRVSGRVALPTPGGARPPRRLPGRVALRNCLVGAAAIVLLLVLLTGCGQTPLPAAAPSTIAPTTPVTPPPPPPTSDATGAPGTSRSTPRPAPSVAGGGARASKPIWPVSDIASARRLQRDVDGGRQPWLLDPVEVATSYAGSELHYANPRATPRGSGVVDVQDGASPGRATVTLEQTATRGDGGIWLVTRVQRR